MARRRRQEEEFFDNEEEMMVEEEEEETELQLIANRLAPLIDVGTMQELGFGVDLHAEIMEIDHNITEMEKGNYTADELKKDICKLGAMVFNEVSEKSLMDRNKVSIGGKKRRKSRRRKRTRKRRKSRRRKRR